MNQVYTVYQCSICRRQKDIPQDNIRATPNQCIITKGCYGRLFPIGETLDYTPTAPVAGLTDWYPRGQSPTTTTATVTKPPVSMSTSATGVVSMAVYYPPGTTLLQNLVVNFDGQLAQDVSYLEYIYNTSIPQTIFTGKDSLGKNLRFDTSTVLPSQIFVMVNGVARFPGTGPNDYVATNNTITFNSVITAGASVSIYIYSEQPTIQESLTFTLNSNLQTTVNYGSWGNISSIQEYDQTTGLVKTGTWMVYTCTSLESVSLNIQLLLTNITDQLGNILYSSGSFDNVRFLLSADPHDDTDRYLNFYVNMQLLSEEYLLSTNTTTITELFANYSALVEAFPPLVLTTSSYITPDTYSTTDAVSSTTPETRLAGTKIIGPL